MNPRLASGVRYTANILRECLAHLTRPIGVSPCQIVVLVVLGYVAALVLSSSIGALVPLWVEHLERHLRG